MKSKGVPQILTHFSPFFAVQVVKMVVKMMKKLPYIKQKIIKYEIDNRDEFVYI